MPQSYGLPHLPFYFWSQVEKDLTKRSSQQLHCAMSSMSILASVIQLAATCACWSGG